MRFATLEGGRYRPRVSIGTRSNTPQVPSSARPENGARGMMYGQNYGRLTWEESKLRAIPRTGQGNNYKGLVRGDGGSGKGAPELKLKTESWVMVSVAWRLGRWGILSRRKRAGIEKAKT